MNQFTIKEDHGDELRWKLEQLSELTEEDFIRLL